MKCYSDKYKISKIQIRGFEFEVLNELKDDTKRTDDNCLYRNRYLFEFDDKSIEEQKTILKKLLEDGLPIRRIVYSGSKSYHTIIQTDFDAPDQTWYKMVWKYLYDQYFNGADQACANPARLTRTPDVVRSDTGKLQKLVYENNEAIFHIDKNILRNIKSQIEFMNLKKLVKTTTEQPKIINKTNNGLCYTYDVIQHYLTTSYLKIKGNGDSSHSLFMAVKCCIKYNDESTLELVLNKARLEKWTEKEIERIIDNIKQKYL